MSLKIKVFLGIVILSLVFVACSGDNLKENKTDETVKTHESKEVDENSIEKKYEKLQKYVEKKEYVSAVDWFNEADLDKYMDSEKYYWYAKAMLNYNNGVYGDAYRDLERECSGFLDSDVVMQEIDSKVGYLNGIYRNKSVSYPMYVIINHGKVAMELSDKELDFSEGVTYIDSLKEFSYTTGEKAIGVGGSKVDYVFTSIEVDGSGFGLLKFEGAKYDTFNGVYERISTEAP